MPSYANVPDAPKNTVAQRIKHWLARKVVANEPMVWTSKGNLPQASLRRVIIWEDEPDYTKMIERYYLGNEVVKESADVLGRIAPGISAEAGRVGG